MTPTPSPLWHFQQWCWRLNCCRLRRGVVINVGDIDGDVFGRCRAIGGCGFDRDRVGLLALVVDRSVNGDNSAGGVDGKQTAGIVG